MILDISEVSLSPFPCPNDILMLVLVGGGDVGLVGVVGLVVFYVYFFGVLFWFVFDLFCCDYWFFCVMSVESPDWCLVYSEVVMLD